jgi:DNA-binding NarL/FixJ family response regulator
VEVVTVGDCQLDDDLRPKTVESHVSSVLRKLQLSSRHQLTRWATERRLA